MNGSFRLRLQGVLLTTVSSVDAAVELPRMDSQRVGNNMSGSSFKVELLRQTLDRPHWIAQSLDIKQC